MATFINCTPHDIVLNNGTILPRSGKITRVSATYTDFVDSVCQQVFGDIIDLPDPVDGTFYVVSALVLAASNRTDLVAPATGHPACIRDDAGHIVSVPGFVSK